MIITTDKIKKNLLMALTVYICLNDDYLNTCSQQNKELLLIALTFYLWLKDDSKQHTKLRIIVISLELYRLTSWRPSKQHAKLKNLLLALTFHIWLNDKKPRWN